MAALLSKLLLKFSFYVFATLIFRQFVSGGRIKASQVLFNRTFLKLSFFQVYLETMVAVFITTTTITRSHHRLCWSITIWSMFLTKVKDSASSRNTSSTRPPCVHWKEVSVPGSTNVSVNRSSFVSITLRAAVSIERNMSTSNASYRFEILSTRPPCVLQKEGSVREQGHASDVRSSSALILPKPAVSTRHQKSP